MRSLILGIAMAVVAACASLAEYAMTDSMYVSLGLSEERKLASEIESLGGDSAHKQALTKHLECVATAQIYQVFYFETTPDMSYEYVCTEAFDKVEDYFLSSGNSHLKYDDHVIADLREMAIVSQAAKYYGITDSATQVDVLNQVLDACVGTIQSSEVEFDRLYMECRISDPGFRYFSASARRTLDGR